MANTSIPNMPLAITLDGTEEVPIVQPAGSASGVSKRTTTQAIADLAAGASGILPSSLAQSAVLLGNGTGAIQALANATSGYILTSNGTGSAPTWQGSGGLSNQPPLSALGVAGTSTATPSGIAGTTDQVFRVASDGGSLGFGAINLATAAAVTGILAVLHGGIGAASLTQHSLLVGNGTSTVASVGPGTSGQVLVGVGAAADPMFATVVGDLSFSESGSATINAGSVTYSKFQTVPALSVVANASSATTNVNAVTGGANQVLKINSGGTQMSFGLVDLTTGTNTTGVLSVGQGGVGTTTLGAAALLLGSGTAGVTSVTNVTSGYVLTSNGPGLAPSFQGAGGLSNQSGLAVLGVTGTSDATPAAIIGTRDQVLRIAATGSALTFGAINLGTSAAVTGILPVVNGGIGAATLTANGVLLGNGTAAISALANVTATYVLTANGTASAPSWQAGAGLGNQTGLSVLGVTGTTVASPGAIIGTTDQVLRVGAGGTSLSFGQINLGTSAAVTGVLVVSQGGVGTSSLTAHGVLVGAGTSTVKITVPGTAGQLLIGQSAATDPVFVSVSGDLAVNEVGTATIQNNVVTYAKLQTVAALSVVANASSSTTNAAAVGGTANQVLRVNNGGTSLGFGQVNLGAAAAITGSLTSSNIATSAFMMLATTGQAYSGGITLTSLSLGTAAATTTTLVAGNPPLQRIIINGTASFVAPSSECEIDILVTNAASASTISFSGYSVGSNTGDAYATTNGNKYILMSRTINGSSTYAWKALQ